MFSKLKVHYPKPIKEGNSIRRRWDYIRRFAPSTIELMEDKDHADVQLVSLSQTVEQITHSRTVLFLHNSASNFDVVSPELIQRAEAAIMCCSWCDYPSVVNWKFKSFRRFPQGVDPNIYKNLGRPREWDAITTGWVPTRPRKLGLSPQGEAILEVHQAGNVLHAGGIIFDGIRCTGYLATDEEMSEVFNSARYISGLRWRDGFECPVLEGLLCGCRPIVFSLPNFSFWWREHAVFVPHREEGLVDCLRKIFKEEPSPVSHAERDYLIHKFGWESLAREFWSAILEAA